MYSYYAFQLRFIFEKDNYYVDNTSGTERI